MILAGGKGTRLGPLLGGLPKPLAPVGNRPFLAYLLDQLAEEKISRVILSTAYKGNQIEQAFGASYESMKLIYSREIEPLGTGGALRLALSHIHSEVVLVMNGDSYCSFDLSLFTRAASNGLLKAALLLRRSEEGNRFGLVEVDHSGCIRSFHEKSGAGGWMNAGVYLMRRSAMEEILENRQISLESEIFPRWAGSDLTAHCADFDFVDIGTPESYQTAQQFFQHSRVLS